MAEDRKEEQIKEAKKALQDFMNTAKTLEDTHHEQIKKILEGIEARRLATLKEKLSKPK